MYLLILIPFALQTLLISFDEYYFHLKRGLPKWERIGHPLDTFSVFLCYLFVLVIPYSKFSLKWFIGLSILSCLLVTKDEFIHKHYCPPLEHWLHALLFINHPIMLFSLGLIWPVIHNAKPPNWICSWLTHPEVLSVVLSIQALFVFCFMIYQILYWNFLWKEEKVK